VPEGFRVSVLADGLEEPRWLAMAPNGDLFVADSAAGKILVLHDPLHSGGPVSSEVFADHLSLPFGIAFHHAWVYVAEQNVLVRYRYDPVTARRLSEKQQLLSLPPALNSSAPGIFPHWTRALAFSPDGKHLFISIGTKSNVSLDDDPERAVILDCNAKGRNCRTYATGLRNAIGIAIQPESGQLWATVNERGGLGDDLPPDYLTKVRKGGFYGFPFSYVGNHRDERVKTAEPRLQSKTIVPDVLLMAHSAPLQFAFYEGTQFPSKYRHGAFIAEHGSSNRSIKSGYDVVFVPFRNGKPASDAHVFMDGFVPDPTKPQVYGRPVGVAVARDGSLLISDDGARVIWRVWCELKPATKPDSPRY
jgi:glucose/arabinose dehydrogenase